MNPRTDPLGVAARSVPWCGSGAAADRATSRTDRPLPIRPQHVDAGRSGSVARTRRRTGFGVVYEQNVAVTPANAERLYST